MKGVWAWLLGATLFAAPWLGGQFSGVEASAARGLVAAAALLWLLERRGEVCLPRPAAWLFGFTLWSAAVALAGLNAHGALMALSDLVTWVALCAMGADAARDPRRRTALVTALLAGLGLVSVLACRHAILSGPGWREFGPFTTPNLFACYLVTLLPLAAVAALDRAGKTFPARMAWLAAPAFAFGLAALLFTGSKGAVLSLAVALVAAAIAARAWRGMDARRAGILAVGAVLAIALGGRTLLGRVESSTGGEAHSGQFRIITWKGAAHMAAAHPVIGVGPGSFGAAFNRYAIGGWTQAAHNAYLQTAAETGIPGLLLTLAALGSAALALARGSRASLVAAAALAGLLAAAAHNVVDYGWTLWAPGAVLWALVGLAGPPEVRPPKWAGIASAVPLLGVLAWALLTVNAMATADPDALETSDPTQMIAAYARARRFDALDDRLAIAEGRWQAMAGNPDAALAAFRDATRISPWDAVAWRNLGEALLAQNDLAGARDAFRRGLSWSPNNTKLLLDAARTEEAAGRHDAALDDYRRMAAVVEGPVGRYPATPELVELEPIYAYDALLKDARSRKDAAAASRYRAALLAYARRYETNRAKYSMLWQATHHDSPADLAEVQRIARAAQ